MGREAVGRDVQAPGLGHAAQEDQKGRVVGWCLEERGASGLHDVVPGAREFDARRVHGHDANVSVCVAGVNVGLGLVWSRPGGMPWAGLGSWNTGSGSGSHVQAAPVPPGSTFQDCFFWIGPRLTTPQRKVYIYLSFGTAIQNRNNGLRSRLFVQVGLFFMSISLRAKLPVCRLPRAGANLDTTAVQVRDKNGKQTNPRSLSRLEPALAAP